MGQRRPSVGTGILFLLAFLPLLGLAILMNPDPTPAPVFGPDPDQQAVAIAMIVVGLVAISLIARDIRAGR